MAQWGKTDDAANSVKWAPSQVGLAETSGNQTTLFNNVTPDAIVTGQTVGQFGVDSAEQRAARAESGAPRSAHAGWVLRTVGSGGRAGRVHMETLVAGKFINTDAADDAVFSDLFIVIDTQPADSSVTAPAAATFTVVASSTPSATLTFAWEQDPNTGTFAPLSDAGVFSGTSTATLSISDSTGLNDYKYRCVVSATGADSVTSTQAVLTVA